MVPRNLADCRTSLLYLFIYFFIYFLFLFYFIYLFIFFVINDLRTLLLDRFLTKPIEELTPDPNLYNHTSLTDQRRFKLDCEEVLKHATQAWTIIRQKLKQGPNRVLDQILI